MPLDVRGYQANRAAAAKSGELLDKAHQRSDSPDKSCDKASVTPLRPRTLTTAANEFTDHAAVTPKRGSRIREAVTSIRANQLKAKSAGVDCARKSFASKALGVALAALGVAVIVSITVSTGGAALAGAVAIAGLVFAVSVADASCAYMNLKNAEAIRDNKTLPFDLPGGASSIRNVVHRLYRAAGMSEGKAKAFAGFTDGLVRLGIGIAMAACTMGVTAAADSFEQIAPFVGVAVNLVQSLVDFGHDRSTSKVYAEGTEGVKGEFNSVRGEIRAVRKEAGKWLEMSDSPEEEERLQAALRNLDDFESDLDKFESEIAQDVAPVEQIVPTVAKSATSAITGALPAALLVASVLIPGFDGSAVRVAGSGGTVGQAERRDPGDRGPLVNPYALI